MAPLAVRVAALGLMLGCAGCGGTPAAHPTAPRTTPTATATASPPASPTPTATPTPAPTHRAARRPLAGLVIALDPGHQLGNHNFPVQTGRLVDAGGFTKPCNTTGTATADGFAEATFAFRLAQQLRKRLVALGARVPMTRTTDSQQHWGPCVDARGRFPGRVGADVLVSLHADGEDPRMYGFHVIVAPGRPRAFRLAEALRSALVGLGVPRSTYVANGLAIRSDLGTLNLATVPAVMVEFGNMLNPADARRMTTPSGRATYADAVVRALRAYFRR